MKSSTILSAILLGAHSVFGHAIFQRIKVNDVDQGQLVGVRAPSTNTPVQNVNSDSIICNTGLLSPVSQAVVKIPAGAKVSTWYQHVTGGPQYANDADNPIAASHKGPLIVYLAKVSSAAIATPAGQNWFKVAEQGMDTASGKWGVDSLIAGGGWWSFTMPSCIAPGQYLMRVELIALHSAYSQGQAQFYMSCANIEITGSGTVTPTNTVKFPGAYSATDPGIMLSIYDGSKPGIPNNNHQPYKVPGPAVMQC